MTILRRALLALVLAAGISPAFAQSAPPPVPALPDAERRTTYTISGSTCACAVNFALYGDSTDYGSWIEVFVNGSLVSSSSYTITSPTGALGTIPRPITDAVLTFNAATTGTVQIVGARRPRRVSQFAENRGVAARDLNQVVTDIVAMLRENWDKTNDVTGRAVLAPPGETLALLPIAANRANLGACFDSGGNLTTCVSVPSTTFSAGNGITFTGVSPTVISTIVAANTQAIDYTIQPSDCGKTVVMSGGFKTVTLPAAGSLTAGCEVTIKNNESAGGRGKKLVNFPADVTPYSTNPILYLQEVVRVKTASGAWVATLKTGRWPLPSTTELCVRQDGSATADGLGNGTVAADCLPTGQAAVIMIGQRWDGGGYNACNVGYYAGGTSTFNESVSMTGQSSGCYLTFNWRGATTHTNNGPCFTGGDNGIAIFNMNLGFVPIFQCNISNAAGTGAFYGHQTVIYDWFGSWEWIPSGGSDHFVFMDAQGRGVISLSGGGMVVGDGAIRAFDSMFVCDAHCAGFQVSGAISFSANVTCNRIFDNFGGSWMNTTATFTGTCTGITTSRSSGNSILMTNGTTILGGTTTAGTGGAGLVCTTKC